MRTLYLTAAVCLLLPATAAAQGDDLTALGLEVSALQTLQDLDLEADQLKALKGLAKGAAAPKPATKAVKASEAFAKTLKDLRAALIKGDDDKISELQAKLDDLREKENIDLGDRLPLTDSARKRAPQV